MQCFGNIRLNSDRRFTVIDELTNISFDNCEVPEYISGLHISDPSAGELTFDCDINVDLFKSIYGLDPSNSGMSCSMEFQAPYQVQKRRHRKKRINKKWAKRYGYITEFKSVKIRDCSFITNENEIEFTGNYVKEKTI